MAGPDHGGPGSPAQRVAAAGAGADRDAGGPQAGQTGTGWEGPAEGPVMGGQTSGGPARTTDSSIGEPNRPQTPFTTASQPASQRGEMPGAERTRHPGGSGRARAYGPSATGRPQDPQR